VGATLGAGSAEKDPIPATKKGERSAVPPAKLCRRRHRQLPDGHHHVGQLPVGPKAVAGEGQATLRAATGPGGSRRATVEAAAAKIVAASQEHDGIAEEIQADGAGGFLLEVFHGVFRSHGGGQGVGEGFCFVSF